MSDNPNPPNPTPEPTTPNAVVGNLREVMGILALIVVVGAFAVSAVAIYLQPSNVTVVLASVMQLASTVIGFFFATKATQQAAQAQQQANQ